MKLAPYRLGTSILCGFSLLPQAGFGCKCVQTRPACEVVAGSSAVFAGTVTDTGPTFAALQAEVRRKLSPKEIERFESPDDLPLSDVKRIWQRLLPKGAEARLRRVRSENELQQLIIEYFPVLGQWERAVRFTVDETFKGEPRGVREVWTGQGYGDCGFDFELGHKYLVYAYRHADNDRDETSICSRTREFSEASADVAFLRAARDGMVKPSVFGIVTRDLDEFRRRALSWTDGPAQFPAAGVQVSVESEGEKFSTQTDGSGQFAFENLPAGQYILNAVAEGLRFTGLPKTVEVKGGSCSVNAILAQPANNSP